MSEKKTEFLQMHEFGHDDDVDYVEINENFTKLDNNLKGINKRVNQLGIPIEEFGAVGDGVTDDTTAFRNAILNSPEGTKLLLSGTYLVNNVYRSSDPYKKNIHLEGVGGKAKIKLKPVGTTLLHNSKVERTYAVRDYLEEFFVPNWKLEELQLYNGKVVEYIKVPAKTEIPSSLYQGSILRGHASKYQAEVSSIDKNDPDGAGTARIYLIGGRSEDQSVIGFRKTGAKTITDNFQIISYLHRQTWIMDLGNVQTIPWGSNPDGQMRQLTSGYKARIINTLDYYDKDNALHRIIELDSFPPGQGQSGGNFYSNRLPPFIANENYELYEYVPSTTTPTTFATFNRNENVRIENIEFDGSNYDVGATKTTGNDWSIIYSGAVKNLTIRDCIFRSSIKSGIKIDGNKFSSGTEYRNFPEGVTIDNCRFYSNRSDIEIGASKNVSITNCFGDSSIDFILADREILDSVFIDNCSFNKISTNSPTRTSGSVEIAVSNSKFFDCSPTGGVGLKLYNCFIHRFRASNLSNATELTGCTINRIDGESATLSYGNSAPILNNCIVYALPSMVAGAGTPPAGDVSKLVAKNTIFDLSLSQDSRISSWAFDFSNVVMTSRTTLHRMFLTGVTAIGKSSFVESTFANIEIELMNNTIGSFDFRNCRLKVNPSIPNVKTRFINSPNDWAEFSFTNCLIQTDITVRSMVNIIDCVFDGETKPIIKSYRGTFANGLKSTLAQGIDWAWAGTPLWNDSYARKLKFNNVSVSKNIPANLGVYAEYSTVTANSVAEGCTVLYMDDTSKFATTTYASGTTLMFKNVNLT